MKLAKIASRPNVTFEALRAIPDFDSYLENLDNDVEVLEQAEIEIKYAGYINKEKNNADKLHRLEHVKIPENFDYSILKSLSYEAREKLSKIQPIDISQASRISGVSPSDISVLLVHMGR